MEFSELVKRFAAAAASGNGDALADLFTAGGTYDDYFFGPQTGREAIKTMLAHFSDGGGNFRWEFFDAVQSGSIGYASYRFSFDSKRPEAKGARVMFEGVAMMKLRDGKILEYHEVANTAPAFVDMNFAPERIAKIFAKQGAALKARPEMRRHLA